MHKSYNEHEEEKFKKEIMEFRKELGVKRIGECIKCGKCCKSKTKLYTINYKNKTIKQKGYTKNYCVQYDKEKKVCKAHGNDKPYMCKLFPWLPENLYKGCGFKFVKIEGNDDEQI